MDHSLNKTRFQGVKLIFDSEIKQFFPKKHVRSLKIGIFHPKMYRILLDFIFTTLHFLYEIV